MGAVGVIADSTAVKNDRMLSHHQAAIIELTKMLQNPNREIVNWLDLGCGRGQIIAQLPMNIYANSVRKNIRYSGYDAESDFIKEIAEALASKGGMGIVPGELIAENLSGFPSKKLDNEFFDLITCTNVLHELDPYILPGLIIESIVKLSDKGILFIHDMELLDKPELGSLPWLGTEIGELMNTMFEALKVDYRVYPNVWKHSTITTWTMVIQREFISTTSRDLNRRTCKKQLIRRMEECLKGLLYEKYYRCDERLSYLVDYAKNTSEQNKEKDILTNIHYTLTRYIGKTSSRRKALNPPKLSIRADDMGGYYTNEQ